MIYILEIYEEIDYPSYYYFNTYKQCYKTAKAYRSCYDALTVKIYDAIDEYTIKRHLIKEL